MAWTESFLPKATYVVHGVSVPHHPPPHVAERPIARHQELGAHGGGEGRSCGCAVGRRGGGGGVGGWAAVGGCIRQGGCRAPAESWRRCMRVRRKGIGQAATGWVRD